MTPLRFANPSPPSGWVEDFHLQAVEHARHTGLAQTSDLGGLRSLAGTPKGVSSAKAFWSVYSAQYAILPAYLQPGAVAIQGKFVLRDRYRILIDFGPSGGVHSHGLI